MFNKILRGTSAKKVKKHCYRAYALRLPSSTRSRYNVSGTVNTKPALNEINTYIIDRA